MLTLEWLTTVPARAGATPLWNPEDKCLYWSDPDVGELYRYCPENGTNEVVLAGRPVGAMTLQADGSLLLFRDEANVITWRDGVINTIVPSITEYHGALFSAAVADSSGRILCTMLSDSKHTGRLFSLDRFGHFELLEDGFGVPRGLAFDRTGRELFLNDAHGTRLTTWKYDYDVSLGVIGDRRPFFDGLTERFDNAGAPAGIAIAQSGEVIVARQGGASIVCHSKDGAIISRQTLNVARPFGLAFGGEGLSELYITTCGGHRRQLDGLHAGEIARMRIEGIAGHELFRSQIGIK